MTDEDDPHAEARLATLADIAVQAPGALATIGAALGVAALGGGPLVVAIAALPIAVAGVRYLLNGNDRNVQAFTARHEAEEAVKLADTIKQMSTQLNDRQKETMRREVEENPLRAAQVVADHATAALPAGEEKREALRHLTAARFDPRKPRETRDLYFKIAEGLSDAEIHGLLAIQSLPKGVKFEILETQVRPQSLNAGAILLPGDVLDAIALLSHQHPELIPRRDAYYAMSALAVRLVAGMQAYRAPATT